MESTDKGGVSGGAFPFRSTLLIFRRRWRLALAVFAVTFGMTSLLTLTSRRYYRPQATIEIRPERPLLSVAGEDVASAWTAHTLWENYYRTQEAILTSEAFLDQVLGALPEAIAADYQRQQDPLREFSKNLQIEKIRSSFILKIGYVDPDAEKATKIVNTFVSLYLEQASQHLRDTRSSAVDLLSKESLPEIRQNLEQMAKAVREFQVSSGFTDPEEHHRALLDSWRKIIARLTDAELMRVRVAASLNSLKKYEMDGLSGAQHPSFHQTRSLEPLIAEHRRLEEEIARERKRLKPQHPRIEQLRVEQQVVERAIKGVITDTLAAMRTDLEATEGEVKALQAEREKLEKAMVEDMRRLSEYRQLQVDLNTATEMYGDYLKRRAETKVTSGASMASVRVLSYARPSTSPYKPNVPVNLLQGAAIGLLLGIGAMLLTDRLSDQILSADELETFVGVQVLAVVPQLEDGGGEAKRPVLLGKDSNVAGVEAFRVLRTELTARLARLGGAKVVVVVSPLEAEGKTTIAANLARVLAMENRRVLLLDGDMRKPHMRELAGVSPQQPGLEHVLRGEVAPAAAISSSAIERVDVLGAAQATSAAAELVSSPYYAALIAHLRQRYDLVVVDSGPVVQVAESVLIAQHSDAVLLVVRDAQTPRSAARMAKKRLDGIGVKILGAILNCARPHRGYGYYPYYYYQYAQRRTRPSQV